MLNNGCDRVFERNLPLPCAFFVYRQVVGQLLVESIYGRHILSNRLREH